MPLLVTSDEVHPLAGLLQRLGKLLALPDVHCILHGLDAKGVHIDCELHFDYNWPGASSQCRRTSPWWSGCRQASSCWSSPELSLQSSLAPCSRQKCTWTGSQTFGLVLHIPLVAVPRLESLQRGDCLVLLHLDGHLCARPFHTWVKPETRPRILVVSEVIQVISSEASPLVYFEIIGISVVCKFSGDSLELLPKNDFFSFSGESFAGVDFLLGGCNSSVQKIMLKKANIEVWNWNWVDNNSLMENFGG